MKIAKFILLGIAGLVLLAVLGIAAALVIVDGAFVKARLERMMKEKNRTLVIEGVPSLRLFPVAGIALGKTSLSEPGGGKSFVALESAEVALRVLPLLSGELAIETLKVTGLALNVVRRKDGTMNFSDLAGAPDKEKEAKSAQRPALRVAEVDISKVLLTYRDEASGQELNVADLSVKSGRLDGQTPGDLALSLRVTGKRPEVDLRAQAAGALSFNLRRDEFGFDKFTAQIKGRVDRDSIAAEFAAPKLQVSAGRASGSEVKGSLQLRGSRSLDLSYTASFSGPPLAADIVAKLDESNIKAKITLADLAPLKADFDASIDRLSIDRYLPPEQKEARADERINLSALQGKTVTGKLAIGSLVVRRAKLENLKAEIKLAGGKLEVSPYTANLYGGTLNGGLSVDADGNKVQIKQTAQNVALGALLRDVTQKDVLEGRGTVTADVRTAGPTPGAMRRALAGSARVQMKEGAIKGINLAESARNAKAALGGKQAQADPRQKTDFSEAGASFNIKNGVARNDDLKVQSPFLRIGGAGNFDIGNNGIDYLAKTTLAATSKGQGGRDVTNVTGVTVPVKLYGALDNPSWSVDYTGLLGGAAGGVTDTVKKGAGSITDSVRGLFKR
jgi:AsmA protein